MKLELLEDQQGNKFLDVKLAPEQLELLRVLNDSSTWKLYRQVLLTLKEAYVQSLLPSTDPNHCMKTLGLVAGLNLAINQLGASLAMHDQKLARSVERETKNAPQGSGVSE